MRLRQVPVVDEKLYELGRVFRHVPKLEERQGAEESVEAVVSGLPGRVEPPDWQPRKEHRQGDSPEGKSLDDPTEQEGGGDRSGQQRATRGDVMESPDRHGPTIHSPGARGRRRTPARKPPDC